MANFLDTLLQSPEDLQQRKESQLQQFEDLGS